MEMSLERLFLRIMPAHPERTAPGAAAVNGFSVALWKERGYVDPATAVEQLVAFHQRVAVERNLLFTAYNAWFDISFVDHLFRGEGKTWRELFHYFVLDLPSMAWSMGLRNLSGPELNQILQIESETDDPLEHTGLTGVESNVAFYRALLRVGENGAMGNTSGKPF